MNRTIGLFLCAVAFLGGGFISGRAVRWVTRVNRAIEVRPEHERYHDLLIKRVNYGLTSDEWTEYTRLERKERGQ